MKLGEIKIEALKLMFASDGFSPKISELPELSSDENFKFYLAAMNGSINRCFSYFEQAQIVPAKFVKINTSEGTSANGIVSFDLEDLEIDALNILSVVKNCGFGLAETELKFRYRNNILEIEASENGEFVIKYSPKLVRISDDTSDTIEIDLPESYTNMIAYFIKGELYCEDEPELAKQSMNKFDSFVCSAKNSVESGGKVKCVYNQTEMWYGKFKAY